jgi:hypothetical protein
MVVHAVIMISQNGINIVQHVNVLTPIMEVQLQLQLLQLQLQLQPLQQLQLLQLQLLQVDADLLNGLTMYSVMMKTTTLAAIGMVVHAVTMKSEGGINIVQHVNVLTPIMEVQLQLQPLQQVQLPQLQPLHPAQQLHHPHLELVLTYQPSWQMLIELLEVRLHLRLSHGKLLY